MRKPETIKMEMEDIKNRILNRHDVLETQRLRTWYTALLWVMESDPEEMATS